MSHEYPSKLLDDFRARASAMGFDPDWAARELTDRLRAQVCTPMAQIVHTFLGELERKRS